MLINKNAQAFIDRLFSVPLKYDEVRAEIGVSQDDPPLAMKAYRDGKLVHYINYTIINALEESI